MYKEGKSYFTTWNDYEVMYHVSTMMGAEQHRRLIGNDVTTIIYQEGTPLNVTNIDFLGTVPQIFGVVQPIEDSNNTSYKYIFFSNVTKKIITKIELHLLHVLI